VIPRLHHLSNTLRSNAIGYFTDGMDKFSADIL
jgi:hypothetical protein